MTTSKKSLGAQIPPAAVAIEAARGPVLRGEFGCGGTDVGVKLAGDFEARKPQGATNEKKIRSCFARYTVDKRRRNWGNVERPSAGYVAQLLWGDEDGKPRVEGALTKVDRA